MLGGLCSRIRLTNAACALSLLRDAAPRGGSARWPMGLRAWERAWRGGTTPKSNTWDHADGGREHGVDVFEDRLEEDQVQPVGRDVAVRGRRVAVMWWVWGAVVPR